MTTKASLLTLGLSGFFMLSAGPAMAYTDICTKPNISGVSKDSMTCLSKNLVLVYGENGPAAYDSKGKTIIPANRYTYILQESEGLIAVANERDGDFSAGYISPATGKQVIPLKYRSTGEYDIGINSFSEGLIALLNKEDKYGFLNTSGKTVIPFKYRDADSFSEGLAAVSISSYDKDGYAIDSKYGYIDKAGKTVVPFKYDYADSFSEGLAVVRQGTWESGKWGVINKQGKTVIPLNLKHAIGKFSNGLASVLRADDTYGFINTKGKLVIPYNYLIESYEGELPRFENGKARVIDKQGKSYCINTKGNKVSCD